VCLKLAECGADVAAVDLLEAEANETAEQVKALGRKSAGIVCDISKPDDVERMFAGVVEALGGAHILVNNAGITRDGLIVRMSDQDWASVIAVNLTGTFNCCRVAAKHFMKQRYGRIVSVSSVVGVMGNPGQANYCASKAGVIGLTKSLAKELASRGVTANAVAPGFIETEMTAALPEKARDGLLSMVPLGRPGGPEDVAKTVAFLASDDADYITGQVIHIDGGMAM
jgi:3-oxoacyl-[acyl-carrier protein] reductase